MPSPIVSNQDSKFLTTFWTTSWRKFDTSLKYSSKTHLQTVGQTEVVSCTLGNLLGSICGDKPRSWNQALRQEKFAYNNTVHGSTEFSRTQKEVDLCKNLIRSARKLIKEEDMMIMYLRRERISTERVPTEQQHPDWNSRVSSFEERH